jgi:phage shock protein A
VASDEVANTEDMIDWMEHEREKLDEAVEDMELEAKEMRERSEELADRAEEVKSDWRAKQADESVPGAQPSRDSDE